MYLGLVAGLGLYAILPWAVGSAENVGFYRLITANASILAIFMVLGMPQTIIRFFPHFKDQENNHHGFVNFFCLVTFIGFLITTIICLLFPYRIIDMLTKSENRALVEKFYIQTIVFAVFVGAYNVLQAFAQAVIKPARTYFYREILVKLGVFFLALACGLHIINYTFFIHGIILLFGLLVLLSWLYLYREKDFLWAGSLDRFDAPTRKEISTYSIYNFVYYANVYLIENVDAIIISKLAINSLSDNGVYAVYMFMGYAVVIPQKAITSTTGPLVSQAFKDNDLGSVNRLYKKSSLIQLIIGGLVFIGIIINLPSFEIFYSKFDKLFTGNSTIAVVLGLAKLYDAATGMNSSIISMSNYYRWNFYMNLCLLILVIVADIIIIPRYGIIGIAFVTASVIVAGNTFKLFFIKAKFGIQPFTINTLKVIAIIAAVLSFNYLIPRMGEWYMDIVLRSFMISILYAILIYYFKPSPDIITITDKVKTKVFGLLNRK